MMMPWNGDPLPSLYTTHRTTRRGPQYSALLRRTCAPLGVTLSGQISPGVPHHRLRYGHCQLHP